MTETQRKLAALQNCGTRYEVVLELDGSDVAEFGGNPAAAAVGAGRLVGYTGRKSTRGLVDLISDRGEAIVDLLGDRDAIIRKGPGGSVLIDAAGATFRVRFTGRTQRDAIVTGELASL